MLVKELDNGKALIRCTCGKEFEINYDSSYKNGAYADFMRNVYNNTLCDKCKAKRDEELRIEREKKRKLELLNSLEDRLKAANICNFVIKRDDPPKPIVTEFFKNKIKTNLLITGETGTGKTTSSCFALKELLKDDYASVYYLTRSQLLNKFVEIKTSPQKDITSYMTRLLSYDNLIIDELVGRAGDVEIPPASQEFIFDIIDNVYNLNANCTLWILGNFYKGSLNRLFTNAKPLIRRLYEAFECYIVYDNQTIKSVELIKE